LFDLIPLLVPLSIWDPFIAVGGAIMRPLYWVVSGLLVLFHQLWSPLFGAESGWTWALSIMSLTVVIRIALIPLFVKQIKSSRQMQLLQPKVRELQKKYGHDREKLGQETMKLYREHNANPLSSCLPLLLQMPIFLALFRVLDGAANGIARGHWLEIHPELVASLQSATIFGAPISATFMKAGALGAAATNVRVVTIALILAMTATLFVTQLQLMRKNMPPEALTGPFAQQQKMMLYLFPIIFAVGGINFPIGVLIYWLTSNLWTMGQQFYVIRRNPAPGTPAYEAWEARRKEKLAHKAARHPDAAPVTDGDTNGQSPGSNGKSASGSTAGSATQDPPRVVRQQPRKQPRSQRKR
jgi:YidC/Oxa1 family membrane protein insertase